MESVVLSSGTKHTNLPENYVRPESERPRLLEVTDCENVPIIDLNDLDRSKLTQLIGDACKSHGFFQVINHGISSELVEGMMQIAHEFFHLPLDVKMKFYSDDPTKTMRLSTSFNLKKETVNNWRDYLRLHCHPLEKYVEDWPSVPSAFKYVVGTYCKEVRQLGFNLLGFVSMSLGLEEDYMEKVLGDQGQHMAVNYYPPCPAPELTYGLPHHTDPNTITILLQGQEVPGLQVLHNGKWVAVNPHPGAFVVNIGDQVQALSNGRYKSVWHRAIVNTEIERISVASFLCPANDAIICPATTNESPAVYRKFTYDEYYKKFWSRNLDQEHCLEFFKNK
ncbi:hypothetical protein IFM89_023793 [Coptis chinensis]|uniref:Fe2OG dioxygenase domain-containing protein n=1 Tax=Coptis chinensis TaxID=261450 RepID=A0A835HLW1_9MAGN|nr:hypothetical protein IFM89_023793 [Coptis chinensis]